MVSNGPFDSTSLCGVGLMGLACILQKISDVPAGEGRRVRLAGVRWTDVYVYYKRFMFCVQWTGYSFHNMRGVFHKEKLNFFIIYLSLRIIVILY